MVGIPVSMREAKFVIQMADREGDGELCYDEFVRFRVGRINTRNLVRKE